MYVFISHEYMNYINCVIKKGMSSVLCGNAGGKLVSMAYRHVWDGC